MSNWKISQLPLTAGINETDLFEKVDGLTGVSERNTMVQVATRLGIVITALNSSAFTVSSYSLTGNNAQSLMDLSGTWNTTGTPTAIKLAITDTASNAASLLMDLQVGASSRFQVNKVGAIATTASNTQNAIAISYPGNSYGIGLPNNTYLGFISGGSIIAAVDSIGLTAFAGVPIGWSPTAASSGPPSAQDTKLWRDGAANTLALRNAANTQTFRIYGTFTDAANYERLSLSVAALHILDTEAAGTGTRRGLIILNAGGTLGFFGNTPVVKQTQGATLTNNVTAGGVANTLANYTDLTIYANDAAAIRNDIYQLGQTLKTIVDGLRLYGLFT